MCDNKNSELASNKAYANKYPVKIKEIEYVKLNDETVLINFLDGRLCFINKTGVLLWLLSDGKRNVKSLKNELRSLFPETPVELIQKDLQKFITTLEKFRFIRLCDLPISSSSRLTR